MPHHHRYSHASQKSNNQRQQPPINMPTTYQNRYTSQMLHQQERSTGHTANGNNAPCSSGHAGNLCQTLSNVR